MSLLAFRDTSAPAAIKNDLSRTPAAFCAPEPPTVYIDLRDTVSQKGEALTDETQRYLAVCCFAVIVRPEDFFFFI